MHLKAFAKVVECLKQEMSWKVFDGRAKVMLIFLPFCFRFSGLRTDFWTKPETSTLHEDTKYTVHFHIPTLQVYHLSFSDCSKRPSSEPLRHI